MVACMSFGDYIREKRKLTGLTQEAFAKKVGVTRGFISQLETDISSAGVDTLESIVRVLRQHRVNVTEGEVFKEAGLVAVRELSEDPPDPTNAIAVSILDQMMEEWQKVKGENVSPSEPSNRQKSDYPRYLADGTPDVPEELRDFEIFGQVMSAEGIEVYGTAGCGELEDWVDTPAVALMRELGGDFVIKLTGDSMQPRLNPGDYAIIRLNPEMETGRIYIIEVDGQLTCKTYAGKREEGGETIYRFEPANHRYGAINAKEVTIRGRVVGRIELDF